MDLLKPLVYVGGTDPLGYCVPCLPGTPHPPPAFHPTVSGPSWPLARAGLWQMSEAPAGSSAVPGRVSLARLSHFHWEGYCGEGRHVTGIGTGLVP